MNIRSAAGRAAVFTLLLVLPLVAGSRLLLDLRSVPESTNHLEREHDEVCVRLHDHEVCILLYRAPWARSLDSPVLRPVSPVVKVAPTADEARPDRTSDRLLRARSPPRPS